jgi:hypothetical protein
MRRVMIRYSVRPDQAEAVVAMLAEDVTLTRPPAASCRTA